LAALPPPSVGYELSQPHVPRRLLRSLILLTLLNTLPSARRTHA
jgi:hypothetical protein